jgi:hypothetical protein
MLGPIKVLVLMCALPTVQAQNQYATFDFVEFNVELMTEYETNPENVEYLKAAISNELSDHGLSQSANPDLAINIGVVVEEEVQTRESDITEMRYLGQRQYHWEREEVVVGVYKVGTVSVELVDTKSNKVVWEGSDANVIRNQKGVQKKIDKGVARIFRKFDVNKLGS